MSYCRYSLFYPNEDFLMQNGYGKVAHVPCVFDEKWRYAKQSSWYLRDRAKGCVDTTFHWAAATRKLVSPLSIGYSEGFADAGRCPTNASLETIGRRHINFLEWCEWSRNVLEHRPNVDEFAWKYVTYEDLIQKYRAAMLSGSWGQHRLAPSTVDARIDEACFFLRWAHERGLREWFHVDVYTYKKPRGGVRSNSHKSKDQVSRTQRVRAKPIYLEMPREGNVERWLKCVEIERGYTKALMCRLMKESGIRREECVQWRMWTLPLKRNDWKISISERFVIIKIEHGAKGEKYQDEYGDEIGPARLIHIPIELAEELDRYREFFRPKIRSKYIKDAATDKERRLRMKEPDRRLFLSEYNGLPISAKVLYNAWTEVSYQPVKEWHPQLMRHYWAVTTLWKERSKAIAILKQQNEKIFVTGDWITGTGQSDIMTIITPQLGHVSEKTTKAYLVWLRQMHDASDQHDAWIKHLEMPATTQ